MDRDENKRNVFAHGGSKAFRLPADVCRELDIKTGDKLEVKLEDGKIVLTKEVKE